MTSATSQTGKSNPYRGEGFDQLKVTLILKAKLKYGYILPVRGKSDLFDCFTYTATRLIFWFNTASNNTRILTTKISAE